MTASQARRHRGFWLALIAISIAAALLTCEVGGRVLGIGPRPADGKGHLSAAGWAQEDALLGWTNRAGTFRSVEPGEAPMTFWPGGRRASWHDNRKIASNLVYVFGGSFTQAYGVEDGSSFVFRLNDRFPDIRFDNFGVGGYGGYQALLLMRQVVPRSLGGQTPDLVIYAFIGGHLRRNLATSKWIKSLETGRPGFLVPPHVRVRGDRLEEFPAAFIDFWPLETLSVLITLLHEAVLAVSYDDWSGAREEANLRVISLMRDLAVANRSGFLVALLDDVPDDLPARLRQAEISFVDCVNPAFGEDPRLRTGGDTGHPSAAQHELWSACIARWLSEAGLGSKR